MTKDQMLTKLYQKQQLAIAQGKLTEALDINELIKQLNNNRPSIDRLANVLAKIYPPPNADDGLH